MRKIKKEIEVINPGEGQLIQLRVVTSDWNDIICEYQVIDVREITVGDLIRAKQYIDVLVWVGVEHGLA